MHIHAVVTENAFKLINGVKGLFSYFNVCSYINAWL